MTRGVHSEAHRGDRIGWLRAAVLGANDGIVSTASIVVGVASANTGHRELVVAGLAGMVAGAMSMASGEYVSVSSQSDTESADLAREKNELATQPEAEEQELAGIYVQRGLTPDLAARVARQLTDHDALGAHLRDELGISATLTARPVQAALASAASFGVGALMPLLSAVLVPLQDVVPVVGVSTLLFLAGLGAVAARTGGAPILTGAVRVMFWGALAMAITAGVGRIFGTAI